MKNLTKLALIALFQIGAVANAKLHFDCEYRASLGTTQKLTFDGPEGGALIKGEPFMISINGDNPVPFHFRVIPTHVGAKTTYTHRHPVFVSDITIWQTVDFNGPTKVSGTWVVDHPPVINFTCKDLNSFDE